ncbi:MAG: GDSL-like Lipase/Acylhydrolase [Frankiales bacterium]|jgi:hypothetical protein|nr:GDSL-like Lipase/Acylhydrolase [Frankiales bacterium]
MRLFCSPTVRRPVAAVAGLLCAGSIAALTVAGATTAEEPGPVPRLTSILVLGGDTLAETAASTLDGSGALYGWDVTVRTSPGSGFARASDPATGAHVVRLRKTAEDLKRYDLVVVQGGEADRPAPAAEVELATLHLIDYVRAHVRPGTGLALVGPVPESTSTASSLAAVNQTLQRTAAIRQVPFVDLTSRGWTRGRNDPFLLVSMLSATSPVANTGLRAG